MTLPVEKIIKWRMNKIPPAEISARLGLPIKRIQKKIDKLREKGHKFPRITKSFDLDKLEEVKKKFETQTLKEIASFYKFSISGIRQVLIRNGVDTTNKIIKTSCHRGHDIAGNDRGRYRSGNVKCLRCERERKAGLYKKTHCRKGHALEDKNLVSNGKYKGKKYYICKICRDRSNVKYRINLNKSRQKK